MNMTKSDDNLNDLIRLQLKKPRNWNWELTTSRSSPHISLPIIQLYNAKGRLLLETKDSPGTKRQSWHSSQLNIPVIVDKVENKGSFKDLQRCRSDNLHRRKIGSRLGIKESSTEAHEISRPQITRLQRCRSDTLNQEGQPIRNQFEEDNRIRNIKSEISTGRKRLGTQRNLLESIGDKREGDGINVGDNAAKNRVYQLQKSKSDVLEVRGHHHDPPRKYLHQQTICIPFEAYKQPQNPPQRRHRRSNSDDLFRRKLKFNEESLKRAEQDGYRDFITPYIPEEDKSAASNNPNILVDNENEKLKDKRAKNCLVASTAEHVVNNFKASSMEVTQLGNKKYKLRQSRAGILVVSDEDNNVNNSRHRRRRRTHGDGKENQVAVEAENSLRTANTTNWTQAGVRPRTASSQLLPRETNVSRTLQDTTENSNNLISRHVRQTSDPTGAKTIKYGPRNRFIAKPPPVDVCNDQVDVCSENKRKDVVMSSNLPPSDALCLFYSKSDVFPFNHLINDKDYREVLNDKDYRDVKTDDNSNYLVQEPVTTPGSEGRKNSGPITETQMQRRRKKVRRKDSNNINSSSSEKEIAQNRNINQGHLIRDRHSSHSTKSRGCVGSDVDLLQLVRCLSTPKRSGFKQAERVCNPTAGGGGVGGVGDGEDVVDCDHVNGMGANVSRHSAKGLSGRRSQSSGNICNGKGGGGNRPGADGKICSSLPNYLDDNESTCNNNQHACEKPPLEEVDRIPPLSDGAPLHWKFSDTQTALCDQGYGSERSPEEEYPPPLPDHDIDQCHHHLEPHECYPFITPESTFTVKLAKGSRGLGLSVTGGIDSGGSWPGLIRIKRLFPHQPASTCGLLNVGDLLLEVNNITLTGLTNYEALEVLRTAPNQVELRVCRPPPDVLNCVSPISEVPPPPPTRREPPPDSLNLPSTCYGSTPEDEYYHGEFEVTLIKIQGSLGFTLRKEDDSALGHYVRALVREPALTDGRIRAGDKIIAVNDVEMSPMSHEQAVQFLRQCGDKVKLRLYRDAAQTPVAALSPTETTPRASFSRKANLRQEAVDMLNDIAVRKLIPGSNHEHSYRRTMSSPNSSPRRLRRNPCPSDASHDSSLKYLSHEEQFHEGLLQKCSHPFDDDAFNSLFLVESEDGDRPSRPSSLDLYNPNQTPVAARKPRFNFSLAHNAYELNNLDPEVLDAPNLAYNLGNDDVKSADAEMGDGSYPREPASMPYIPLDTSVGFSYKNPAYQSAHPQCGSESSESKVSNLKSNSKAEDAANMTKWKGVVMRDDAPQKVKTAAPVMPMKEEYEILSIELNRGWNSRLGFSLQGAAGVTYVSAVHADSVAAKDGRIKPGDRILKVNDESVEHMSTNEIIDLLRIVRGPVCIVVKRVKSNEDCLKSNAEN